MYNLIHLHTDPKFFYLTETYENKGFNNVIIFLGESNENIENKLKVLNFVYEIYPMTQDSILKIVEKFTFFSGAVIYDLCGYKQQFLDQFPKSFKFFWLFFGYEIYSKIPNAYLSKRTFKYTYPISLKKYSVKDFVLRKISRVRNKEFILDINKQEDIYRKIDAMLVLNKFEYEELNTLAKLPKYIRRTLTEETALQPMQKSNSLIFGNSRAMWNNHLDIIKIINSVNNQKIKYNLFFSYGPENLYTERVRKQIQQNKAINLIEDFLKKEEFDLLYERTGALVINSYRQLAAGNIIEAIRKGCKIYLNTRSSLYKWFKDEGFKINSIEALKKDLQKNNIILTDEEQLYNMNKFKELKESYTNKDFLGNIRNVLNS